MITEQNTTTEQLDLTDMYKKFYYEEKEIANRYWDQLRTESNQAAKLTGYLSGLAKYNPDIATRHRIDILNLLIEMYEPKTDESEMYSRWVSEWKECKEELKK